MMGAGRMDMYQKRKMRAKNNNSEEKSTNVGINWESTNYLNTSQNHWKINIFSKFYLS